MRVYRVLGLGALSPQYLPREVGHEAMALRVRYGL